MHAIVEDISRFSPIRSAGSTLLSALILVTTAMLARAEVINVPADYPTIAEAAAVATAGDTVLVGPSNAPDGRYYDELIVIQPGVSVVGTVQDSPLVAFALITIMDSEIVFAAPPPAAAPLTETARLEWFTIAAEGVLIYTQNPACEIRYNKIRPIGAVSLGVLCEQGGLIERNKFKGYGSPPRGVLIGQGSAAVRYNIFQYLDTAVWVDNDGAAQPALVEVRNNTLDHADLAFELRADSMVEVVNNLFLEASGIPAPCPETTSIRYNDFAMGLDLHPSCELEVGNLIGVDPLFCESAPHIDYLYPRPESPLLDAGEAGGLIGAFWIGCEATGVAPEGAPPSPAVLVRVEPNPVSTSAGFVVEGSAVGSWLDIYAPDGHRVDSLPLSASGRATWTPARSLPAGVYLARLRGGTATAPATKLILLH
jgi:hypothetical protein